MFEAKLVLMRQIQIN